jgi:hypothetical protein
MTIKTIATDATAAAAILVSVAARMREVMAPLDIASPTLGMSDLPGVARPWHGTRFSSVLDAYIRITGEADHQFRRERVGVALPTPDGTWERLLWRIRMYAHEG